MEKPKLSLVLSVKAKNWRQTDHLADKADEDFVKVRLRALQRDNYTCQGCGFKSSKYQEVHHLDDDHHNNSLTNLATVCSFCHNCQHIGFAGMNKEAVLIYLPEFTQAEVNHTVRIKLVAERFFQLSKDDIHAANVKQRLARQVYDAASSVFQAMEERQDEARARLDTSDPAELGDALLQLDDVVYAKRTDFLAGIRLLPLGKRTVNGEDQMRKMVDTWMENTGAFYGLLPSTWHTLTTSILG